MAGLNSTPLLKNWNKTHRMHRDDDSDTTVSADVDFGPTTLKTVLNDSANAAVTYLWVYDNVGPQSSDYPLIKLKCAASVRTGGGAINAGATGGGVSIVNGLSWKTTTSNAGTGDPATPPTIRVTTDVGS